MFDICVQPDLCKKDILELNLYSSYIYTIWRKKRQSRSIPYLLDASDFNGLDGLYMGVDPMHPTGSRASIQ